MLAQISDDVLREFSLVLILVILLQIIDKFGWDGLACSFGLLDHFLLLLLLLPVRCLSGTLFAEIDSDFQVRSANLLGLGVFESPLVFHIN